MDSALLTIKHCFALSLLKVSVLHRENVGNLKKKQNATLIVKTSRNMGEILQRVIHVMVYGLTTALQGFFLYISSGLTFCLLFPTLAVYSQSQAAISMHMCRLAGVRCVTIH